MASTGLAWLAGLGQGAMGFPQGMEAAEKMAMQEQDRKLRERQVAASEAAGAAARAPLDLSPLSALGIVPAGAPTNLDPRLGSAAMTGLAAQAGEARKLAREREDLAREREDLGTFQAGLEREVFAMPEAGPRAEHELMTERDPGLAQLARMLPGLGLAKGREAYAKRMEPKITTVPRGSPGVFVGSEFRPTPRPEGTEFTPPTGSRPIPTVNAQGEVSTRYESPPWQHGLAEKALADAGWQRGMPGYDRALFAAVSAMTPYTEGGGAVPRTFAIPPPPGRPGPSSPTPSGAPLPPGPTQLTGGGVQGPPKTQSLSAEQTANLADFRTLLTQLDRVGKMFDTRFVGPVSGNIGRARTATGIGATSEEATFRSELASIQNSIIYLKSGKQINEQEFERLKRELPLATDPEVVFRAKLKRAVGMTKTFMANREAAFAARGFRGGETGQGQGSSRTLRIRDRNNPNRTGTITLAPGESLPAGLEVIQ